MKNNSGHKCLPWQKTTRAHACRTLARDEWEILARFLDLKSGEGRRKRETRRKVRCGFLLARQHVCERCRPQQRISEHEPEKHWRGTPTAHCAYSNWNGRVENGRAEEAMGSATNGSPSCPNAPSAKGRPRLPWKPASRLTARLRVSATIDCRWTWRGSGPGNFNSQLFRQPFANFRREPVMHAPRAFHSRTKHRNRRGSRHCHHQPDQRG